MRAARAGAGDGQRPAPRWGGCAYPADLGPQGVKLSRRCSRNLIARGRQPSPTEREEDTIRRHSTLKLGEFQLVSTSVPAPDDQH